MFICSLFIFKATNPIRRLMQWLVNSRPFEYCIILTIIANCVVMALDDKLPYGDKTVLSIQMVSIFASSFVLKSSLCLFK